MNTPPVSTHTLRVPGADLYYELRGEGPLVVLIGGPTDARGFADLADDLATDHTVLTTDPRGILRSMVDDPEQERFPELRADDLARLLRHVGSDGPAGTVGTFGSDGASVLGSCGGAVAALALAQVHPTLVGLVVAHEPPLQELLSDRNERRSITEDIVRSSVDGPTTSGSVAVHFSAGRPQGAPDVPRTDEQNFVQHEMLSSTQWVPDVPRLLDARCRIEVGMGADSADQTCGLAARALAEQLSTEPRLFPGGHLGFAEHPAAFAARFREVLSRQ